MRWLLTFIVWSRWNDHGETQDNNKGPLWFHLSFFVFYVPRCCKTKCPSGANKVEREWKATQNDYKERLNVLTVTQNSHEMSYKVVKRRKKQPRNDAKQLHGDMGRPQNDCRGVFEGTVYVCVTGPLSTITSNNVCYHLRILKVVYDAELLMMCGWFLNETRTWNVNFNTSWLISRRSTSCLQFLSFWTCTNTWMSILTFRERLQTHN